RARSALHALKRAIFQELRCCCHDTLVGWREGMAYVEAGVVVHTCGVHGLHADFPVVWSGQEAAQDGVDTGSAEDDATLEVYGREALGEVLRAGAELLARPAKEKAADGVSAE